MCACRSVVFFVYIYFFLFFFKQKTAYEMRISDWSSDVCSSDLPFHRGQAIESHWTSSMQAVGRNADLGSQAVFEAVGETRGQVHVDRTGIDFMLEAISRMQVFGDRKSTRLNSSH